jgi:predicted nucleotide-binding protein
MVDDRVPGSKEDFIFLAVSLNEERSEIRAKADALLEMVERIASDFKLSVVRADKILAPGLITSQIILRLAQARIVIADISFGNPNVMYELGVAHSFQRPVILIAEKPTMPPFDVAVTRTIFYEATLRGMFELQEKLTDAIGYLLSEEGATSASVSPVQVAFDASGYQGLPSVITDSDRVSTDDRILATLGDIRERMSSIESRMSDLERRRSSPKDEGSTSTYSRKIFIVHGHDDGLKLELRNFLSDLEFDPIILHERADGGKTIYSKLLGEASDVGYAFVLLTPDDKGGKAATDRLMPRARQNVVFEHGLFAGYLSPERVCAIVRGSVEIPSDLNGVVYKHIGDDASLSSIVFDLARELKAAGYIVDMNKLS